MTAPAPRAQIDDVRFTPGSDAVTIAYHVIEGSASGTTGSVTTTQTDLSARVQGGGNWGDAEVKAEAQAYFDATSAFLNAALASEVGP